MVKLLGRGSLLAERVALRGYVIVIELLGSVTISLRLLMRVLSMLMSASVPSS